MFKYHRVETNRLRQETYKILNNIFRWATVQLLACCFTCCLKKLFIKAKNYYYYYYYYYFLYRTRFIR